MHESYRLPEEFETERYFLRRVRVEDAGAIFCAYAGDPAVTKYLAWKPHVSAADTVDFLESISADWDRGGKAFLSSFSTASDLMICWACLKRG